MYALLLSSLPLHHLYLIFSTQSFHHVKLLHISCIGGIHGVHVPLQILSIIRYSYTSLLHNSDQRIAFCPSAIYIPTQSVSVEKDDYVNSRNLTLPDLLSQSRHHNEKTRKGTKLVSPS